MNTQELYRTITSLINELREMVLCFRMQNFNRGERIFSGFTERYATVLTELFSRAELAQAMDENRILSELKGLMSAMEQKDYILMADLMQLQTVPFLEAVQNALRSQADEDADVLLLGTQITESGKTYRLEPTGTGDLTLAVSDGDGTFYMHSNESPAQEASLFALQYLDEEAPGYVLYGLGLGYHVLALCRAVHGLTNIRVYESDPAVIALARQVTDFGAYEGRNLQIITDPLLEKFAQAASEPGMVVVIHHPSIRNVADPSIRERLRQLFIQDSSIRNQIGEMKANFRENIKYCPRLADEAADRFQGRDVVLVAAGPSLDKNVELLKELQADPDNRPLVVCVGTAFRKLLGMGLRPDFVGFLDSSERIRRQIAGVELETVPAFIAATATMQIARDYAGEKYLLCQQGFERAEAFAKERGGRTFETGGSVATILTDAARQFGAKRIIAVGLDLAYTGMQVHAAGAGNSSVLSDTEGLIKVTGQDGSDVYTTAAMHMYIEWFERYVAAHANEGTAFIDATEGGALIGGMQIMTLREAFGLS